MTPNDSDLTRIWDKLDTISRQMAVVETRQEATHTALGELCLDVKDLKKNGCYRAAQHDDHESRIRKQEQEGKTGRAIAGGAGAALMAAALAFINWLWKGSNVP